MALTPTLPRERGREEGKRGWNDPSWLAHDREGLLAQVEGVDAIRGPAVVAAAFHTGLDRELPEPTSLNRAGLLVDDVRGHDERRVDKPHGLPVETSKEVPEQWIIDDASCAHGELAMQPPHILAQPSEFHHTFHLHRQRRAIRPMNVDLKVAALFVGEGRSQLDQATAAHHQQLGELVLGDDPLLDQRDSRQAGGHLAPDATALWRQPSSASRTRRPPAHWRGPTSRLDRDPACYRRSSERSRRPIPRCLLATRRAPQLPLRSAPSGNSHPPVRRRSRPGNPSLAR